MQEITVKGIHKSLNENGYICDVPFAASITSAIHSKPVSGAFLYGPAGTGKSYLPIILSKALGVEMYFYQCAPGTREDDLVLKMFPSETTKSGVEIKKSTVFKAAEASHKNKVMLVLDEWDKTRPTADGFFLDFLQYGRLSIPGTDIQANLDNMFIFFTANDEREFHEALLRRFPKIDVNPLEPSLVMSALRITHDGHPHLGNAIKLYEKAVMSGMSKPATIQEIRQLLDAISLLGNGADWNSLVYQFITKTPENHSLLKDAQKKKYSQNNGSIAKLDDAEFEGAVSLDDGEEQEFSMPSKIAYLTKAEPIDTSRVIPSDDEIYGVYDYTDDNYSTLAHRDMQHRVSNDNVAIVDDFEIINDKLLRKKPYKLIDIDKVSYAPTDKIKCDVAFVDENCTIRDLLKIPRWSSWKIRRYSKNEVIARYTLFSSSSEKPHSTFDIRWAKDKGLMLIISSDSLGTALNWWNNRNGSYGTLVNVNEYNVDNAVIRLFSSNYDNGRNNGILNLRNVVNHKHIEFSDVLSDGIWGTKALRMLSKCAKEVVEDGDKITMIGKGFKFSTSQTDASNLLIASVEINGYPDAMALDGIERIIRRFHISESVGDVYLPIYKAIKINTRKLSKHLKRRGWVVSGIKAGLVTKAYRSVNAHCYCFLFDNFAIYGFKYNDNNIYNFSRMKRIVNQLTEAALKYA